MSSAGPARSHLDAAQQAIAARRPRAAFQHLFQAELAHHSVKPEDPEEEAEMMALWGTFGEMLPERVSGSWTTVSKAGAAGLLGWWLGKRGQ